MGLGLRPLSGTRYRSIRRIGEGGMGVVYEAEHIDLGQRVAIKVLAAHLTENPAAVASFRQEARTASRLGAEQIVRVSDFAELESGGLMYAMELLDGPMLRAVVDEHTRLEPARVVAILRQLCKGLAAAHEAGVVHRDIKPDNIGLVRSPSGRDDAVKILDFGLSTIDERDRGGRGLVAGTASYLAPELIEGHHYDHRVDQYALGCTAYEMLTGKPPFDGDDQTSPEDVLRRHLTTQPMPLRRSRFSGVPRSLERVVMRCLAKDPATRYRDMVEVEAALCEAQVSAGLETPWDDLPVPPGVSKAVRRRLGPSGRARSRRRGVAVAAVALIALASGGTLVAGTSGGPAWLQAPGSAEASRDDRAPAPSPPVGASEDTDVAPASAGVVSSEPVASPGPEAATQHRGDTPKNVGEAVVMSQPADATEAIIETAAAPVAEAAAEPVAEPAPRRARPPRRSARRGASAPPKPTAPAPAPASASSSVPVTEPRAATPSPDDSPFLDPHPKARDADFL